MKRIIFLSCLIILSLVGLTNKNAIAVQIECCEFVPKSAWKCEGNILFKKCSAYSEKCGGIWEVETILLGPPDDGERCHVINIKCNANSDCPSQAPYCKKGGTVKAECVRCTEDKHCKNPFYCDTRVNGCRKPKCVTDSDCPDNEYCRGDGQAAYCTGIQYQRPTKAEVERLRQRMCAVLKQLRATDLTAPESSKDDNASIDLSKLQPLCE